MTLAKTLSLWSALCVTVFTLSAQDSLLTQLQDRMIDLGSVVDDNEDFTGFEKLRPLLEGVEIVMLGEQSHGEATAYQTKIKLIKYLHQEMGFDMVAFEAGLYDCRKAQELIDEGEDYRVALAMSVPGLWSLVKEFKPLGAYIEESERTAAPLEWVGFDGQMGGLASKKHFIEDLEYYLKSSTIGVADTAAWRHFSESMQLMFNLELKPLKKRDTARDTAYISTLMADISMRGVEHEIPYWSRVLEGTKAYLSDNTLDTYYRDSLMAENLFWIKEQNPGRKIICWGATSHFLYNADEVHMERAIVRKALGDDYKEDPMMGKYVKDRYGDAVLTIGFTAGDGEYGFFRRRELKDAKEGSLEWIMNSVPADNFLVPLNGLDLEGVSSRPLGNMYMTNDISHIMDAVIFNRHMSAPKVDRNFFLKMYPDNKYVKPEEEAEE